MSIATVTKPVNEHLRRYGHIAARLDNKVILWGGQQHHSEKIWIYDIQRQKWGSHVTHGDVPPRVSGCCCGIVGWKLYIFGGLTSQDYVNTVYILDLRRFAWTRVMPDSGKPSPRDKFGCWIIDQKIVYFGGYGTSPSNDHVRGGKFIFHDDLHGWNNDLISFDTSTNLWVALPHSNSHTPSPRAAHACTKVNNDEGYLFGGRSEDQRLNDLYSFSFVTNTWCKIVITFMPEGRSWHSFTAIDDTLLFLHGGLSTTGETLSDSWLFNSRLKKWNELAFDSTKQKRMWHTSCIGMEYGEILMFGGCEDFPDVFAGMTVFHLSPLSLKRLAFETIRKNPKRCGSWMDLPIQFVCQIESALTAD